MLKTACDGPARRGAIAGRDLHAAIQANRLFRVEIAGRQIGADGPGEIRVEVVIFHRAGQPGGGLTDARHRQQRVGGLRVKLQSLKVRAAQGHGGLRQTLFDQDDAEGLNRGGQHPSQRARTTPHSNRRGLIPVIAQPQLGLGGIKRQRHEGKTAGIQHLFHLIAQAAHCVSQAAGEVARLGRTLSGATGVILTGVSGLRGFNWYCRFTPISDP